MSAPRLKRYRVTYYQQSDCKVDVLAQSAKQAIQSVDEALDSGIQLGATVFNGRFEIIAVDEIDEGGAL